MDFTKFEERLSAIEARLSIIESQLNTNAQSRWTEPAVPAELAQKPKADKSIQPTKSGNWLGIVAIICFILAAGFIIKLSIESGWLTPEKQLGLATLFGLALIAAGIMLLSSDRGYASLLPAAGVIILYFTAFAAYQFYLLISFQTAIAMISIISGLCIWLYIKIKHDIYALIAAIGAYTTPILLELNTSAVFSLYYFILCSLTFATISIWVKSRTLTVISAYLAILVTSVVGFELEHDALIAIVLALHFLIFSIGTYFHTQLTQQQLTEKESWSFFPVLLIFYAMEYYFINRSQPGLAPWVSLGFAGLLIGLYLSAKKWFPDRSFNSQAVVLAFTTVVCFHSIYLELLPVILRPWLFVAIVLGYCLLPIKSFIPKTTRSFIIPALAIFAILGIEYLNMLSHLMGNFNLSWFLVSLAAFASIWFMLTWHHDDLAKKDEYSYTLLGAAHLLGITGLYQLTTNYGSLAVSASWLFYATCVISFAFIRKDKVMAKSALIVLSFAAGKALIYDASSTPTTIRILCLILTGVVLYGSGFLIRKMTEWKN